MNVRDCVPEDLPFVVDILEKKRALLATYEPRLWKQAPTSREMTGPYFASLIESSRHVFLIAEHADEIVGFILASPMPVPPVYDAGPTAVIDDFDVSDPSNWNEVGGALVAEVRRRLKERGVVQFIFISARCDTTKMNFLKAQGLSEHASWFNAAV